MTRRGALASLGFRIPRRSGDGQGIGARAPLSGQLGRFQLEKLSIVLREDGRHAETAHPPQQNRLRLPRRLPAAPGAVQGGVRPVVGGASPPPGNVCPQPETLEGRGAAHSAASDGHCWRSPSTTSTPPSGWNRTTAWPTTPGESRTSISENSIARSATSMPSSAGTPTAPPRCAAGVSPSATWAVTTRR